MLQIETDSQQNKVSLKGELDAHSLGQLWASGPSLFKSISHVDLKALDRVDSSGLAMLVYLSNKYGIELEGINPQLQTLIELYDLQQVINVKSPIN